MKSKSKKIAIQKIRELPVFKTKTWELSLENRKAEEIELHNNLRGKEKPNIKRKDENKKYYSITSSSSNYIKGLLIKYVNGQIFLDYACGNGDYAFFCAKSGALFSAGLDISDVSIKNAQKKLNELQINDQKKLFFFQGDCENTNLPYSSIDVVLCSGMLHHLNLEKAYKELFRLLRPGGIIIGIEALGHNPFIQIYRNITPHLRTKWETRHIMKTRDILMASKFGFRIMETRYWHFFDLIAVPFRNTWFFPIVQKAGTLLDKIFLSIPICRLLAWQVSFILKKNA